MNDLVNSVAVLGRPYAITKSRLGAVTKVYNDKYICDLPALKELFQGIGEKLSTIQHAKQPEFSFLISYADKTHQDGVAPDLNELSSIPIGKITDRIVMRWGVFHEIDGVENEISITVRVSNPINPLVFLQAALSRSPNEIDNAEFEMGSTCVTVDGAGQVYSDEIFLRVQNWIDARNKPHAFVGINDIYSKFEWYIDQIAESLLPLLIVAYLSIYSAQNLELNYQISSVPILISLFIVLRGITKKVSIKMAEWSQKSKHIGLFQITNGDIDAITKMAARAKNGALKLVVTGSISIALNIVAGIALWYLLPPAA
jgi:uncharacterized membrane protein HdeD (DUF308 family)